MITHSHVHTHTHVQETGSRITLIFRYRTTRAENTSPCGRKIPTLKTASLSRKTTREEEEEEEEASLFYGPGTFQKDSIG